MYTNILLAISGSRSCQAAAEFAFSMARKPSAALTLFHVCSPPEYDWGDLHFLPATHEFECALSTLKDRFKEEIGQTKRCSLQVGSGQAHQEILRLARHMRPDLIVMGGHTPRFRRGLREGGSVVERVARHARCPVMVVCERSVNGRIPFSNIVVATDFSERSHFAVQYAAQACRRLKARLSLIHIVPPGQGRNGGDGIIPAEQRLRAAREKMAATYGPVIQDLHDCRMEARTGIPAPEILHFASREGNDLIVLAHHPRKGSAEKAYIDSTTTQVCFEALCPTMSVNRPVETGRMYH